ncbi:MAG: FAD-dependent oxidoreductase [Candidatus Anammoxibacter sp.]
MDIDILGAGSAGIATGYFAKKSGLCFKIYEASGETGGNCRTFRHKDFMFDAGAHRFHDKDPEMTKEVLALMGDEIIEVSAPSYIFHNKRLTNFPITPINLFFNLKPSIGIAALLSFIFTKFTKREIKSFEDYAFQKYGKTISSLFLTNYSEKLWGLPTSQLSPEVAGSRLKDLNVKNILSEMFFPNQRAKHLEGSFYYPKNGFGRLIDRMASFCGLENIALNSKVTKIFHQTDKITSFEIDNNTIKETNNLVSSLPVSLLIKSLSPAPPKEILDIIAKLKFRHLKLVCFFINKASINNAATMYFPDKKFIFTRAYEPKNRYLKMSPPNKTSLVLEIPYSFHDEIDTMDTDVLIKRVKTDLLKTDLIKEDEIIDYVVKGMPYAYPVLEKDYDIHMEQLLLYLKQFKNLYLTGRNGKFVYSWTHNMLRFGKEIVDEIMLNETERDESSYFYLSEADPNEVATEPDLVMS